MYGGADQGTVASNVDAPAGPHQVDGRLVSGLCHGLSLVDVVGVKAMAHTKAEMARFV